MPYFIFVSTSPMVLFICHRQYKMSRLQPHAATIPAYVSIHLCAAADAAEPAFSLMLVFMLLHLQMASQIIEPIHFEIDNNPARFAI